MKTIPYLCLINQLNIIIMNKFEIVSGTLVCSDPCYSIPTWCQGIVDNVKKGTWVADVEEDESWGDRIAELRIHHVGSHFLSGKFEEMPFDGGVDSGQFGFFDKEFYRNDDKARELPKHNFGEGYDQEEGDEWYRACAEITLSSEQWGVLPNGVVSSSGFGDGSYRVFGQKDNNGEYVAFQVVFIDGEEEEEEEEEEE